jgi:hypothetical protein
LLVWKARYQSVSWMGNAAKRKIEEGVVKPRVRSEVVSCRERIKMGFMLVADEDILRMICELKVTSAWLDKTKEVLLKVER